MLKIAFSFVLLMFSISPVLADIHIGAIYNSSGSQADLDMPSLKGAQLAVAELNKKGGLLGQKVVLDVKKANSNYEDIHKLAAQLASDPSTEIVIGLSDNQMVQHAAPPILNAGKLFVSSGATGPALLQQFPRDFYLTAFTDNVQAAAAAQFAANQMHRNHALVLHQFGMSYAKKLADYFVLAYQHYNGTVDLNQGFQSGKLSALQLDALRKNKRGIIFLAASPENVPKLIAQIRKAKIETPIMGGDSYVASAITELGSTEADNVYYTTHGYFDKSFMDAPMEKFVQAYQKYYGVKPESIFTALGYDTVNLVATAIQKAKSTQPQKINAALKKITAFPAVTGEIDLSANPPIKIVTVVKILSGNARIAAMVIPQYIPPVLNYVFPQRMKSQ